MPQNAFILFASFSFFRKKKKKRGILRGEQPLIFCEAKTKANEMKQGKYVRDNAPSIAPLKYTNRICNKVAYGAMDDNPGKSRGGTPFCRRSSDRLI